MSGSPSPSFMNYPSDNDHVDLYHGEELMPYYTTYGILKDAKKNDNIELFIYDMNDKISDGNYTCTFSWHIRKKRSKVEVCCYDGKVIIVEKKGKVSCCAEEINIHDVLY